ncbi:MAG: hypothetical protein KAT28_04445 [Candidatus Aenigmarchaeota archaeon]|nr:hypothetical protein [Candidatus Aenigmarchaeota archaeon]
MSFSLSSVENPFKKKELTFDYSKVPEKYHATENSEEIIKLYKGGTTGFENIGFLSNAILYDIPEEINKTKKIIETGHDELIYELFNKHTINQKDTPLLSATFNPEMAQVFAPTNHLYEREDKTIYQIKIEPNRCVVDYYDVGKCGQSKEFFILGAIFPEEISAVKIINDDEHSELLEDYNGVQMIKRMPDRTSNNRKVKDSANWIYYH